MTSEELHRRIVKAQDMTLAMVVEDLKGRAWAPNQTQETMDALNGAADHFQRVLDARRGQE